MAGKIYPSTAEWLDRNFREYLEAASSDEADVDVVGSVRGLVSPHIDYQRGGAIYAQVWQQAAKSAKEAEVAVILGTNHHDCQKLFTMTRQSYSTPWGVMPTAGIVVDEVAAALGDEEVFAEELHHRTEHSVEAAAVWLHYFVKDTACEMVPVLCGSFHEFTHGNELPDNDEWIYRFVEAVRRSTADRRILIVAAADLAHVGPAFGDPYPIDVTHRASMSAADTELMDCIARGDAEGMFSKVKEEGDRRRICGLAPIYLALRILGDSTGRITGYEQCPADQQGTSFVSICGMVLS
jgi:AmmeMemoRadiSam system protein B